MNDYGEKTRARIKDALEALVEEGSGKKPTVSEVLSRSGVARSTFYVYYENFQDLLEELAADYSAQIIRLIRENRGAGTGPDSYRDAYRVFIDFVAKHRNAYAMLLKSPKLEQVFLSGIREYLYDQYLADFPQKDPELLRYSADACTNYVYSILRLWAKNGFDKTPEELGDVLTESIAIATDLFGER